MTIMTCNPKEVRQNIIDCFDAGLVPFVTSSPGIGKSSIYAQIAKDFGLILIDLRLSQCAPEDLMGLPMRVGEGDAMRATFAPFTMFPLEGDEIPEGFNGWLLLLDEFNSGTKMVQAAAYKVVLDKMVGQAKLHPNVFIGCAGNLATDRAIVNSLSTAMQSRLVHMEMELNHRQTMDYATAQGWDSRVIAYLEFKPSSLHRFKPDHTDKTFPCPRTWEFLSRLAKGKTNEELSKRLKLMGGTVGEGEAVGFHTYVKVFDNLPTYAQILADPAGTRIPTDPGTIYALVTMMVEKFTRDSFEKAGEYAARLPAEFQVVYSRGVKNRDPRFIRDPKFVALRKTLTKYLTDVTDEDEARAAA